MLLAVDGGGTKTHILIADNDGRPLGQAKSGALSFAVVNKQESLQNLLSAINLVKQTINAVEISFDQVLIGLSGVDTQKEIDEAEAFFKEGLSTQIKGSLKVVNDSLVALASGTEKDDAMILIAGTGSNCFGRNHFGLTAKAGGLDFFISDEGSAYYLGHQALIKAVQSADGRGEKTRLEEAIIRNYGINNIIELKHLVYGKNFSKKSVALLAQVVFQLASEGDKIALDLLEDACNELVKLVTAVGIRLNFNTEEFDLVMTGSILTKNIIDVEDFKFQVREKFPKANFIIPADPPVYGALRLMQKI